MSNERLEQSEKIVGQLRKVILTPEGKVVDGFHRLEANPEWGTEIWDNISTDEDYWKTRAHLNYTRRNATENRIEKLKIINNLAEFYLHQGLKNQYRDPDTDFGYKKSPQPVNQILAAVIHALDGAITASWIRDNLDKKYRQGAPVRKPKTKPYKSTPEEAIRGRFGTDRKEQADIVIEDFKEQVRDDLKEQIKADVKDEAREEAREELRRDPDFLIEAAETALEVLPTLEPKVVTPKGEYKPTLTEIQRKQLIETVEKRKEKEEERRTGPDASRLKEIGKFVRIHTGLMSIAAVLHRVTCPITGNPAETDLIFRESGLTIREAMARCDERLKELRA